MKGSRSNSDGRRYGKYTASLLLLSLVLSLCWLAVSSGTMRALDWLTPAVDELEVQSEFSRIVVRKQGSVRSLIFLDDDGGENLESKVDLQQPHRLLLPYSRSMFASYLFRPQQGRVLIVGLGGGAMVHFLRHYQPQLRVDVVEIDPAVVKIAAEYFSVRSEGNVRIIVADAIKYLLQANPATPRDTRPRGQVAQRPQGEALEGAKPRYDVIYMDAFLKASDETDATGVPRRLQTVKFLKGMQRSLKPEGLVVFNVHFHGGTDEYIGAVRTAFPQVYVFSVPHRRSYVVVGSLEQRRLGPEVLRSRARRLDVRFPSDVSLRGIAEDLTE